MLELILMCMMICLSTFFCLKLSEEDPVVKPFHNFEDFFK